MVDGNKGEDTLGESRRERDGTWHERIAAVPTSSPSRIVQHPSRAVAVAPAWHNLVLLLYLPPDCTEED